MDPIGGISPSNPRLDNSTPDPNQPNATQPAAQVQQMPVTAPTLENPTPAAAVNPVQLPQTLNDPAQAPVTADGGSGKGEVIKKVLLIVLALVVLLGIAAGAYFVGFTSGKTKGRTEADAEYQRKQAQLQKEAAESEADTDAEGAAELKLGDLQDPKYVDETLEGEIGKQVSASDGFVLKVTNIERNFKSTDANYKLDSSKELIKVNFLIGNVSKDKAKDISSFNFRLENSTNALLTPENIADYPDKFDTAKLDPGAQTKGSIVYAVNKDEKPLKSVREQRYRISSENREVTTKTVITVAEQLAASFKEFKKL